MVLDSQSRDENAILVKIDLVHVAHVDTNEQHRLSLLESRAPRKLRVQRVALRQSAARKPKRAEHYYDDCDRDHEANEYFVSFLHAWR